MFLKLCHQSVGLWIDISEYHTGFQFTDGNYLHCRLQLELPSFVLNS